MIVRHVDELPEERVVSGETWTSRRLLLRKDGMGFSLHDTLVRAGTTFQMRYDHHFEAVYCIRGTGRIQSVATGEVHELRPGSMYALNEHDDHLLTADTELHTICVFNPPVVGPETHDERGVYPLLTEEP